MFCPNCGYETDVKNQFCPYCGKSLKSSKPNNNSYEDKPEAQKWVKTCALILFVVSLVVFILNFFLYGMYVGFSSKDFLNIDEYFKPIYFLIPTVIGLASIVFGGVSGKEGKGVKNIVIGCILSITSVISLVCIFSFKTSIDNSFTELSAQSRTVYDSLSGGFPIIREEKVLYIDSVENEYDLPTYTYFKFTDKTTSDAFRDFVDSCNIWKKGANETPKSNIDILLYNLTSDEYYDTSTPGTIVWMIYNRKTNSVAILCFDTRNTIISINF